MAVKIKKPPKHQYSIALADEHVCALVAEGRLSHLGPWDVLRRLVEPLMEKHNVQASSLTASITASISKPYIARAT